MSDLLLVGNQVEEPLGYVHSLGEEIVTLSDRTLDKRKKLWCINVRLEQFEIHPDSCPLRNKEPILLEWITKLGQIKKPLKRPNIEILRQE